MEKMCEQTELNYLDGDVVWVKLGSCWWPGEVVCSEKLPADVLPSFRKPPIAVVKFFQEDSYEYVKNHNAIYKYECSRKNEFIQKGLYLYRTKHGLMEKFPEDVIRAETAVGGDIDILTRDEFQETKKESYADLFGDPRKKTPGSSKKGKSIKGRSPDISKTSTFLKKIKEKTNYQVHILVQSSKAPSQAEGTTPSTSRTGSEPPEEKIQESKIELSKPVLSGSTPTVSSSGIYACHACPFTTSRLNVLILHNKSHSVSPPKKKTFKTTKSPKPVTTTQKPRKPRQEKLDEKLSKKQKRVAEDKNDTLHEVKKAKTDEEIKTSLLADWDDGDEDSNEESSTIAMAGSPDVPVAAGSPAVPTSAELPSALVSCESEPTYEIKKNIILPSEKPESSNDAKYDFCEDEDWPVEADVGRKIPRVKPLIRKEETKSLSIDENDMAREVAELLNKATVPELPSAPEPLKVEENFPEPSIVKSPDKKIEKSPEHSASPEIKADSDVQQSKTIFKTKTFFRSRHSRSQDAIGKYVAEQLNAAERLNSIDNDTNGSEMIPSPEPRITSPIEHVKVVRLAPKIQLKKLKAEAAQLRQREKCETDNMLNELVNPPNIETILKDNVDPEVIERESKETFDQDHAPEQSSDIKSSDIGGYVTTASIIFNENNDLVITSDNTIKEVPNLENSTSNVESTYQTVTEKQQKNTNKPYESYMNDSTASAVDALLSVSREADRVTKVISVGPPEDLFEDDNKDSACVSDINGCDKGFNEDVDSNMEGINSPVQPPVSESVNPIIEVLPSNIESQPMQALSEIIIPTKIENFENEDSLKNEITIPELSESGQSNKEEFKEDMQFNPNDLDCQKEGELETQKENVLNNLPNSTPSESDLQIAEALINLPSTTIQNKISIECQDQLLTLSPVNNDQIPTKEITVNTVSFQQSSIKPPITIENLHDEKNSLSNSPTLTNNIRFESEEEKSENLNAAQSLVQMSESIDHKITVTEIKTTSISDVGSRVYSNKKDVKCADNKTDIKLNEKSSEITIDKLNGNTVQVEQTSKLLKILEEPCTSRVSVTNNAVVNKKVIPPSKEKTLNFDVNQSTNKPKKASNQKIIIRRTATPHKTLLNNITEVTTPDKIILSRSNKPSEDGSSVQSYTIQTTPDVQTDKNTIIIQQKIRKIAKPAPKFQKIKPQTTTVSTINNKISKEMKPSDTVFDINSMPIVLSDDILTPESIEKMPIVMSDGNIITSPSTTKMKNKKANNEKITVTSSCNKQDVKHHAAHDINKATTPNILSKSSKVRSPKPVLVIDKTTGKQKFIMAKSDPPIKEVKQQPKLIPTIPQSSTKTEKFVILPSPTSPRPARTQKIVIDPQTGKAHVIVGKGPTTPIIDNKPVSAKLIPSASDTKAPGNTVMIITNAQGTQSRIVLTPEHEKILFPNKQQPNVSQLKTIAHRITTNTTPQQKSLVTTVASVKTPSRIVSKQQKSAIITSKGQLLVGGRLTGTTQNIAPLPEIRPATKRVATEPKKLAPVIQKTEPLIFLQKSGAVMQLTAAQFEHLQRTGQIIQKVSTPQQENKVVVQKPIAMSSTETLIPVQKQRARKQQTESSTLIKKFKHEIAIAPAPAPTPMPALTPIVSTTTNMSVAANVNISNTIAAPSTYSNMPNFEELLPTSTITRSNETVVSQPEQIAQTPTAPLSDGQLLAVPGEHFGGPQGSFYLCVEENGTFTPIDNRPLVLENNQLVPMPESIPVITPQPERRDILEAALANSDVFHAEGSRDEAPDFRDLNANVSVHCRVSETSTTLNQPIMTPVEVPTKGDTEPVVPSNLDDGLAVIGVTPHTVPTSLELPITVTDPRIAPKTTDPLSNNNYRPSLLPSPNTEMTFVVTEETDVSVVGPISMPLLTEEESVGKSMPILIDEITERTVSSVESTVGSPSSIDVRESETEDGSQWPRRLLTPGSDISEASVEIPLQPAIQLSVSDLSHNS